MSGGRDWGDLQDSDEQRIPELLGLDEVVAVAVEVAVGGVVAVGDADEDPDEDDRGPARETVVALEEAVAFMSATCCAH